MNSELLRLAIDRVHREKQANNPAAGMAAPGAAPAPAMPAPAMPAAPGAPPAMATGMPAAPMDPAMMGGAMPGMQPAAPPKLKPEQMMQMLDFRLYNMQQQMTALMTAMGVQVPPGALVTPPGSPTPVAEAALPGGPQDPSAQQAQQGGQQSAISPIEPMAAASPEAAQQKTATLHERIQAAGFILRSQQNADRVAQPSQS